MNTLETLGVGTFLMLYYYFVLRKFNALGFRIFSLCFFTGTAVCYWWYTDYRSLQNVQQQGIATSAIVLEKGTDHLVFQFAHKSGKTVKRTQKDNISVEEFAAVQRGQSAPILYSPVADTVYLTTTYQRLSNDSIYFLFFPGLLYLIGIVCWITLRKYRVHSHEGTMYEYVTDEDGNIVLDDARSATTKSLRTYTTLSKLFQAFDK